MKRKELYKLINEEIGMFDFLGNSEIQNELSHQQMVSSKDFQTKLIHELINNPIIITNATYVNKDSNLDDSYPAQVNLELEITFPFNGREYNMILLIEGEENENREPNPESFNLKLFSKGGEEIKLNWIKNDSNLFNTLIESLLQPYL